LEKVAIGCGIYIRLNIDTRRRLSQVRHPNIGESETLASPQIQIERFLETLLPVLILRLELLIEFLIFSVLQILLYLTPQCGVRKMAKIPATSGCNSFSVR
jgi:hypothetical protein